jgi:hypothetical protein
MGQALGFQQRAGQQQQAFQQALLAASLPYLQAQAQQQ